MHIIQRVSSHLLFQFIALVSEVHKLWGNEKRECVCLSLSLRFSLGAIKDDEHEGLPSLHIAFLLRKTGDFSSVKLNRRGGAGIVSFVSRVFPSFF